ncbi:cation-translocating P-type ATPase [Aquabacterium sp. A08]|uniref:cation-translocating P-type ATPase n=1 Tax=Aquabacterium sp. A08 TaxID=2718532 RepID=UPI0014227A7F|nr:cation-translocating P-type ATPase [Aquabacterium sp. A08]NIC40037.1 cation-translocating P-type ATPase [Aquabacterium sp. A08]
MPLPDDTAAPTGLSAGEAARRLLDQGPNELGLSQRRTLRDIAGEVLREPMFLLLLGAGALYLVMGDAHEAGVLLGFVVLIMGVTVLQERRTDRALDALRDLSSPRARVLRDGVATRVPGREVVVDDVLLLADGDRVPADAVLLQVHELATDESLLTGESLPVAKRVGGPTGDPVFAGTLVVAGQGVARVTATGARTELGRIGRTLDTVALAPSPLRDEVARLTRRLVALGLTVCAVLVATFWLLRGTPLEALLAGITLAMSVLPQEFSVIMIVFFALGARRMAARQVLARRLNAIETLGQTTVLCVDKTGTLTQNRMAVAALSANGQALDVRGLTDGDLPEPFHELLEYAVLASETAPHDPMEQAFHRFAGSHLTDTEHLHPEWALVREYELSPELLAMSHLWHDGAGAEHVVATKGAPEAIADLCHLPPERRRAVAAEAERLAEQGLRVLAVAKARHRADRAWPNLQHDFDFEWLGLVGLADPLRPQVPEAVRQCRRAGIRVVMMTGDHPQTARRIAEQAGIEAAQVLTGDELERLDPATLSQRVAQVQVFARMAPTQKLLLVQALKARGEVVAMTGDGVNDAPALKAAHIGVAMGQRGTDVAREAAALVLLDDDFASIVDAIRLGRRIYANLRQAMRYTLAVHVPIILLSLLPLLLGLPLLLLPVHIAFLELVIDPSCSVVFEAQEGPPDLMEQPPRRASQPLLVLSDMGAALWQGAAIALGVMGVYLLALRLGLPGPQARAQAFVALVAANAALIALTRAMAQGWRQGWLQWPPVPRRVLAATLLALAGVGLWPPLAGLFGFAALGPLPWAAAVLAGVGCVAVLQGWLTFRRASA